MKKIMLVLAALVLAGGAFYGGTLYAGSTSSAPEAAGAGARNANGPMTDMTDEERAAMADMTEEERAAFLEEQGMDVSAMPGGGGASGAARGGLLEGEVIEVASDTITLALESGGSQTVYYDDTTVTGYAEGATDIAAGSQVLLFSASEADGVTTAQAIIVQ
ncbi:MAG: hypothetical protein JXE06_09710 [Coriobacteriia bacterium]|nr:hypothetical protein [Coriobacteriia bacterium]MBN2821733.1 hypothetical protein [Coriobacteriia bacterium]